MAGALVVAGATALEHVIAVLAGQVPARDLNAAWTDLPAWYGGLTSGHIPWERLPAPGSWPVAATAAWLSLVGRSPAAFELPTLLWVLLLLGAVAVITTRRAGPLGALAAVALAAQLTPLVTLPRGGWIHSPEAATTAVAAALLVWDPRLARRGTVAAVAVAGALALGVRTSGLLWVGLLTPLVVGAARTRPLRAAVVGACWAAAAWTPAHALAGYGAGKLGVRARYDELVPGVFRQIAADLGVVTGLLLALGIGLAAAAWRRPGPNATRERATAWITATWILAPLALGIGFGAGLDNFPLLYAGLVLLAAPAIARHRALLAATLLTWAVSTTLRVVDLARPAPPPAEARVAALLDATCPDRTPADRCLVVVDQGLYHPQSEEPGRLELFLAEEDAVELMPLHRARSVPGARADALATWECGERDDAWQARFPDTADERHAAVTRWALSPAWNARVDGCRFLWLTPRGRLPAPERAPDPG